MPLLNRRPAQLQEQEDADLQDLQEETPATRTPKHAAPAETAADAAPNYDLSSDVDPPPSEETPSGTPAAKHAASEDTVADMTLTRDLSSDVDPPASENDSDTAPDEPSSPSQARRRLVSVSGILSAATWMVVLALLVVFWPANLGGKFSAVIVAGDSMEPTMALGDLALAWEKPSPEVGDILVYKIPEGNPGEGVLVVHRITDITEEGFITRGDNRPFDDHWVPGPEDQQGVVQAYIPTAGAILLRLTHPLVLAVLMALAATLFFWPSTHRRTPTEPPEPLQLPEHLRRPDSDSGSTNADPEPTVSAEATASPDSDAPPPARLNWRVRLWRSTTSTIPAAWGILVLAAVVAFAAALPLSPADLLAFSEPTEVEVPAVTYDHFEGNGDLDGSEAPGGGTWEVVSGGWGYEGDSAVQVENNSPYALALLDLGVSDDIEVEVLMSNLGNKPTASGAGIAMFAVGPEERMFVVYDRRDEEIVFYKRDAAGNNTQLSQVGGLGNLETATLTVQITQPTIKVLFNDTEVIDYTMTSAEVSTYGANTKFGMTTLQDKDTLFDYFWVTDL